MKKLIFSFFSAGLLACSSCGEKNVEIKPNIIIIYVDDLGYGDISVNGAKGVSTPNVDRLAINGINFTDAHSTTSTCTPSRFSLLTGSYAFRNNAAVLQGDGSLLINPEKGTIASMLKKAGYKTAVIGKWHLGLGIDSVNWNEEIKPGPREVGFDYSFLIPATGDRVPCIYLENQRVVGAEISDPISVSYNERLEGFPTGTENPELLKVGADLTHSNTIINGVSRIGYMSGGNNALWKDEEFPFILTEKAKTFITDNKNNPFFLYYAYHDIHVPRIPNEQFVGKSEMGPRGDAIVQMDWCTGQLIQHLETLGLSNNTMVVFTSDNGPILDDGYEDQAMELVGEHQPAGPFRGAKYSIYEAGNRMPTIVYWPGTVKPKVSSALMSQVDLYASFAKLVGQAIVSGDAPDSEDHLDAWLGKTQCGREWLLEEAYTYAIRKNEWKFILPQKTITPQWLIDKNIETGLSNEVQLFNLKEDIGELINVADKYPEIVDELRIELFKIIESD